MRGRTFYCGTEGQTPLAPPKPSQSILHQNVSSRNVSRRRCSPPRRTARQAAEEGTRSTRCSALPLLPLTLTPAAAHTQYTLVHAAQIVHAAWILHPVRQVEEMERRILKTVEETKQVGASTLAKLHGQHEQLNSVAAAQVKVSKPAS